MNVRAFPGIKALTCLGIAVAVTGCGGIFSNSDEPTVVYAMDNSATGNSVFAWELNGDGTLSSIGSFATNGNGTGTTETPGAGPVDGIDPLGSQGALSLSSDERHLFAVNAGSGTVSVFRVQDNGSLTLTDTEPTGGSSPVSVTCRNNVVYVVNVNNPDSMQPSTITGFTLNNDGTLTAFAGSTRGLSADNARPSQVSISPDGEQVIVTERGTNVVTAFGVNSDRTLGTPATVASPRPDPFGFAFVGSNRMVVSEAAAMNPLGSSASLYNLTPGAPTVASGGVLNNQMASCWVTISPNGQQAYVSNTGSNTITNYNIGSGSLTLQQEAVATDGLGSAPIDSGQGGGKFVQLLGGKGTIAVYSIQSDGDLALLGIRSTGLPLLGTQGLAVRD